MSASGIGRQPTRIDGALTPAEQHLGDRLAALIDGELGHDARERVLSHLATCCSCKAEAEAQRRVKNVFADTAPPPPSDGLLARLQGLPAGGADGPRGGPGRGSGESGGGTPDVHPASSSPLAFGYLPGGGVGSLLSPDRGFRIHDAERLPSRGRRFAFAAAGAVSMAALALGGAFGTGAASGGPSVSVGDGGGTSASTVRTASSGPGALRERRRRSLNHVWSEAADATTARAGAGSSGASVAKRAEGDSSDLLGRSPRGQWARGGRQDVSRSASSRGAGRGAERMPAYPLLRDAEFTPSLMRSSAPTFAYDSYLRSSSYGSRAEPVTSDIGSSARGAAASGHH